MKRFGPKQVHSDILLSCNAGEIIGLLGRNGSGKSTLMRIIFGSLMAETKFVKADGKLINGLADSRNLISYLPHSKAGVIFLNQKEKIEKKVYFCNIVAKINTSDAGRGFAERTPVKQNKVTRRNDGGFSRKPACAFIG